jgi:hypothetical protein
MNDDMPPEGAPSGFRQVPPSDDDLDGSPAPAVPNREDDDLDGSPAPLEEFITGIREFLSMPDDVLNLIAGEICATMPRMEREVLVHRLIVLSQKLR